MNKYDVIIGLEIHIQTKTESKMFCSCSSNYFEKTPNSQVCSVCLGLPGALPIPNKTAIEKCILLGLATNCKIVEKIRFDRKHYFYPDLPKGYQISQYDNPICSSGYITVKDEENKKIKVELERIHQEEDVAKSLHMKGYTLIDYNKSGVALIEIVTKPVIQNAYIAKEYAARIRQIVKYLDISNADMEKGQMRCEPNISLQKSGTWKYKDGKILPIGSNKLNPKVEIKNIGSISAVEKSINFEINRITDILDAGEKLIQQTRGWNAEKGITEFQRSKETAEDYRYFPEPDIPVIRVTSNVVKNIEKDLTELPEAKVEKYTKEYKLSEYDAQVLTATKEIAEFYEKLLEKVKSPKTAANWLAGPIFSYLNETNKEIQDLELDLDDLAELISKVEAKEILNSKARELLEKSLKEELSLKELMKTSKCQVLSDEDELVNFAKQVIEENPKAVKDYSEGKTNAMGFLIGQLMKLTRGNANPESARDILHKLIKGESDEGC
jgi:aspartyl-tRNA(Asn)/glutamyl-tRNA(Gln) amidotransferase subunit B